MSSAGIFVQLDKNPCLPSAACVLGKQSYNLGLTRTPAAPASTSAGTSTTRTPAATKGAGEWWAEAGAEVWSGKTAARAAA